MTYSDIRAKARENLRGRWGVSVAAAFVAAIFGALLATSGNMVQITEKLSGESASGMAPVLALLASAVSAFSLVRLILGGVVQLGYARFLLNQHDGREHTVKDLFSQFDRFSVGFLQLFLRELFVALWCILLVVPGIIKSFSYAMTPFILAEHPELTAKQAIRRSMEMMDGHKGQLFVLGLTFIGWEILNGLTLGIGSLWLNPYKNAAYAVFYRQLKAQSSHSYIEA
jgi:uncharacterized membrane protein